MTDYTNEHTLVDFAGQAETADLADIVGGETVAAQSTPSAPEHTLTCFPNQFPGEKRDWTGTLDQLADVIRSTVGDSKAELPFFKLATFGDEKSVNNCYRTNANVKRITGVEADYDAGSLTFEAAVSRLREVGVAGLIYTTPSYTEEKPRWRVLCPTSGMLPPQRTWGVDEPD
jgi:hypothetical protein